MSRPTNDPEFEQSAKSTIFSAPSHTADETPKRSHTVRNFLLTLLVLAVLAAGTFAVIRLFPPRQAASPIPDITVPVVSNRIEDIAAFTVTNAHGAIRCTSEIVAGGSILWTLEGIGSDLTNSASIGSTASAVASFSALRQMTDATADYGLDSPRITVFAEGRNSLSSYTLLVGSEAPAKSGSYVQLQGHEEVYLVEQSVIAKFAVKDVDFAALTAFHALKKPQIPPNILKTAHWSPATASH